MFTLFRLGCMGIALVLCLWAADTRRRGNQLSSALSSGRIFSPPEAPVTAVLLCLALGLMLWQALAYQGAALTEEKYAVLQAEALGLDGHSLEGQRWPALFTGFAGEGVGPLLSWLALGPVGVFGRNVLAARLPLVLVQWMGLCALWHLTRTHAGKRAAWVVLFLGALSPWLLFQARWSMSWQLFAPLLALALWMWTTPRRAVAGYLGGMVVLALCLYTGDAAYYVAPLFALLAAVCVIWQRRVRPAAAAVGILLFGVLALPALGAFAAQVWDVPWTRVFGMEIPRLEAYAHTGNVLRAQPEAAFSAYASPAPDGNGWQWLPWLRNHPYLTSLYGGLLGNALWLVKRLVFQLPEGVEEAMAYSPAAYGVGTLYALTIPFTLLGLLLGCSRLLRRGYWRGLPSGRRLLGLLLGGLLLSALPFALFHEGLSWPHLAFLMPVLLLCSAYGIVYVIRRLRWSAAVLAALYALNLVTFALFAFRAAPTYPGLNEAMRYAAQIPAGRVVVTERLYPGPDPAARARVETLWGFDVPVEDLRAASGEGETAAFDRRFVFGGDPAGGDGAFLSIVHVSQWNASTDTEENAQVFGEFVVLDPSERSIENGGTEGL